MMDKSRINSLAMEASKDEGAFNDLFLLVEPHFKKIVKRFFNKMNLMGFTFDLADYYSVCGQALWEAVKGYDINKGDFLPRLSVFAGNRMIVLTDYNLSPKRFDKSLQMYSFDELFGSEQFDITEEESTDLPDLINEFIQSDREGEVIAILTSTADTKRRNKAFTKYYGQYGSTERKKVQRVRERLQAHLTSNGVSI